MDFKPTSGRIAVKRLPQIDKLGTIYLPTSDSLLNPLCEVLAVSNDDSCVKKGDIVVLDVHAGYEWELDGEEFIIAHEDEIVAIVKQEDNVNRLIPLGDRVWVKETESMDKIGSIAIPEDAQHPSQIVEIIALGAGRVSLSGKKLVPPASIGDKVITSKYSGWNLNIERESYRIIRFDEILGVVENEGQ